MEYERITWKTEGGRQHRMLADTREAVIDGVLSIVGKPVDTHGNVDRLAADVHVPVADVERRLPLEMSGGWLIETWNEGTGPRPRAHGNPNPPNPNPPGSRPGPPVGKGEKRARPVIPSPQGDERPRGYRAGDETEGRRLGGRPTDPPADDPSWWPRRPGDAVGDEPPPPGPTTDEGLPARPSQWGFSLGKGSGRTYDPPAPGGGGGGAMSIAEVQAQVQAALATKNDADQAAQLAKEKYSEALGQLQAAAEGSQHEAITSSLAMIQGAQDNIDTEVLALSLQAGENLQNWSAGL